MSDFLIPLRLRSESIDVLFFADTIFLSLFAEGLSSSLFPIRLPQSIEEGEDLYHRHMKLFNDYYKEALKYLRAAVCSTRPELDAVLPFIQVRISYEEIARAKIDINLRS